MLFYYHHITINYLDFRDTKQIPLQVTSAAVPHYERSNKQGRPHKGNVINFGPQPQSMVSKFLSKLKDDCPVQVTNEGDYDTKFIPSTPIIPEPDQTEEDYLIQPKRYLLKT